MESPHELPAPSALRLVLLGGASLYLNEQELLGPAVQRRRMAVLIALVRAPGRRLSREAMLALLWTESSPDAGRRLLNEAVYVIRRELGPETIRSIADDLVLHDGVRCDVDEVLAALERGDFISAASHYGGPFLGTWFVRDAPAFSDWVDDQRALLTQRYQETLTALADEAERAGDWALAAEQLRRLLREDPLRSSVTYRAALALARSGEAAAALQLLQSHRDLLHEELGAKPSEEIRVLEAQIRAGSVRGGPAARVEDVARVAALPTQPVQTPTRPLQTELPAHTSSQGTGAMSAGSRASLRQAMGWAMAVGVLALSGVMALVARKPGATVLVRAADSSRPLRLLVAPYQFIGRDDQRYMASGLLADITGALAPQRNLQLLSSSLLRDTTDTRTAIDVAASAEADLLLEGRFQVDAVGGTVRLSVGHQLIRVPTGEVLWSWRQDGNASDAVEWSSLVTDSVAQRLGIVRTPPIGNDGSSRNLAAIDFFHQGNAQRAKGRDGYAAARALYGRAIERDSSYARALARHAEMSVRLKYFLLERDPAQVATASRLLDRAKAIAPSSAEVLLANAHWYLSVVDDVNGAVRQLDTTLRLHPDFAEALTTRATIRRRLGDWTGAAEDYKRAVSMDPHSYPNRLEYGNTLLWMHRHADARPQLEFARELDPRAVDPHAWLAGLAIREAGDTLRAMREIEQALPTVNRERLYARLALTFPEVLRAGTGTMFRDLRPLVLADALGDSAAYFLMKVHQVDRPARERQVASDSALLLLSRWATLGINPHRTELRLARVMQARGDSAAALVHIARALEAATQRKDALSLAEIRLVAASLELQYGRSDSAGLHVRQLLAEPSALSPAVLAVDPIWKALTVSNKRPLK